MRAKLTGEFLVGTINGQAIRKVAAPRQHDVLCGRGGGINSHKGNRIFRDWVAERRTEYNLTTCKLEKVRIAKEVMDLVKNQQPPGRFLVRDDSGGIGSWWVEINDAKAMAKTSQALREGAPSIRAERQQRFQVSFKPLASTISIRLSNRLPPPLMPNQKFADSYSLNLWRKRNDSIIADEHISATPPLTPISSSPSFSELDLETDIPLLPPVKDDGITAIKSDLDRGFLEGLLNNFVNPFENDDVEDGLLYDENWDPLNEIASA
jgi:hypothetical protein